eukprot:scaffold12850_cov43-Phaeocystis_antarctica.AAC.2
MCARARARCARVCVRAPGRHGCLGGGRSRRRGTAARSAAARACRADVQRRHASSRPQRSRVVARPGGHPAAAWGRCRGRRAWGWTAWGCQAGLHGVARLGAKGCSVGASARGAVAGAATRRRSVGVWAAADGRKRGRSSRTQPRAAAATHTPRRVAPAACAPEERVGLGLRLGLGWGLGAHLGQLALPQRAFELRDVQRQLQQQPPLPRRHALERLQRQRHRRQPVESRVVKPAIHWACSLGMGPQAGFQGCRLGTKGCRLDAYGCRLGARAAGSNAAPPHLLADSSCSLRGSSSLRSRMRKACAACAAVRATQPSCACKEAWAWDRSL